jgi:ABC-type multidrug transport system fused ATPase/permease subunit
MTGIKIKYSQGYHISNVNQTIQKDTMPAVLLFMGSIDSTSLLIILLLLILIGWLFFRLIRWMLSKLLKGRSPKTIRWWAVALFSLFTLFFVVVVGKTVSDMLMNGLEMQRQMRKSLDQHIEKMKLKGKTKEEVVGLLGETDTTSNKLIYDLPSMEGYVLEIEFENGQVVRYQKQE